MPSGHMGILTWELSVDVSNPLDVCAYRNYCPYEQLAPHILTNWVSSDIVRIHVSPTGNFGIEVIARNGK